MSFHRPEILSAIPVIWFLLYLLARTGRSPVSRWRRRAALFTRGLLLSLLAAAAAGPHRKYTIIEKMPTAHLPDRSASISPPGQEEATRTAGRLADAGPLRGLPFGDEEATDARPALLQAAVRNPARMILQTDGHLAAGAEGLVEDLAADRPVGVLAIEAEDGEVPVPAPPPIRLEVPRKIEEDEAFTATVTAPGADEVALSVDGHHLAWASGGLARFPDLKLSAGTHLLLAHARTGDVRSVVSREVAVEGPLDVLILGGGGEHPFAQGLSAQGIRVGFAGADGRIPNRLEGFRVVVALPGSSVADAGAALTSFVIDGGGLLLASGAPPGLARLAGEPIAEILPATARPPEPEATPPPEDPPPPPEDPPEGARPEEVTKDAATLSLVLVIDRSGSMRGEKIGLARAACYLAAQALDPVDRFGVLAFNHEMEWVHPISDHTDLASFRRELISLDASGGTEIFVALKTAADAILREDTAVRHILLVSDGQDVLTGFRKLLGSLRMERVSVSTVGVGEDFEMNLLGTIARWGAGEFYAALDPKRLPQVVTQDTRRIVEAAEPPPSPEEPRESDPTAGVLEPDTKPPEEAKQPAPSEPVGIRAAAPLPFLSGLSFPELPEVEPIDVKFPAQIALETGAGAPALAFWRVGKGRVALFPADPAAWSQWEDLPRFAAQTVRMLAGEPAVGENRPPELEVRGREIHVVARGGPPTVTVSWGKVLTWIELQQTGPDSYRGRYYFAEPGDTVEVTAESDDGAAVRKVAILPLSTEALTRGVDRARIARLADRASRPAGEVPPAPEPERRPGHTPEHLPFLIAALVLLPIDVGVRRIGR